MRARTIALAAALLLACGCGGGGGGGEDTTTDPPVDLADAGDTAEVPADAPDAEPDTSPDAEPDPSPDVETDAPADTSPDTEEDAGDASDAADASEPTECRTLDPFGYGPCDMALGVVWNGSICVYASGCSCAPDCAYFFPDIPTCIAACA